MTEKEKASAKLLVMLNAIQYLVLDRPPHSDKLEVETSLLLTMIRPTMAEGVATGDPSTVCAMAIAGYYTNGLRPGSDAANANANHPELYARMEDKFLGNSCIRNFLSAMADAYREEGDASIYNRLLQKQAYVTSSPGKDSARDLIAPRKRGFWASLFG